MLNDLRVAFRSLRRNPGFAAVVTITLGLGVGANTAIFSVVRGVLLQPPPFRDIDRLAMVWQTDRAGGTMREPASIPDFADFERLTTTFAAMAAFAGADVNATSRTADPIRLAALEVSHDLLPLVGIQPLAGRTFTADEDRPGAPRVAVISERLWEREFGRESNVERHAIRLNEIPHTIVGVVPRTADFGVLQVLSAAAYGRSFADRGRVDVDVWLPLRGDPNTASRDNHPIFVMGRLADGVPLAAAQGEMTRIAADLERTFPQSNEARGVMVEQLGDVVLGPIRPALYTLLAAVGLVLLVACGNVVNLLLARSAGRAHEVAVRRALGADVWRLMRQFFAEGLLLSGAAAGVGLVLAAWVVELLIVLAPVSIPRVSDVTIDLPVLGATLGLALFIAMIVGLVPALQARHGTVQDTLKAETSRTASAGKSRRRVQSGLVVVQVGLAIVLAIGAALLIRSFWQLRGVDAGFQADGVLKLEFQLPENRYPQARQAFPDWPEVRGFQEELVRRTAALPGVEAATVVGDHPLAAGFTNSFVVVGREAEARNWPEISLRFVSAQYFRVTGTALLSGRLVRDSDTVQAAPVVLINETARQKFFPDRDPTGQQMAFWGTRRTIVGVVANEKIHGLEKPTPPAAYVPVAQAPIASTLLVRVTGDPRSVAPGIRAIFREMDPQLAVYGVEPLRETVAASLAERRFTMLLLGSFALLTLLVAAVGVYGLLSYVVAQRTGEIGVRMALGAQPGHIVRLVIGQGLLLVVGGVAVGTLAAAGLSRLLTSLLFGTEAIDPVAFAAAPLALMLTAMMASYLPARRASKVDPVVALRLR